MQDTGHIDKKTAKTIRKMLDKPREPDETQDAEFILNFYKDNYDFVQIVICESCERDLCLWVLDRQQVKQNMHKHHLGLRRIEISGNLLSTRKRHDGVIGYECICGADTRVSEVERGYVTQSSTHIPADEPHIEALIKRKIVATNFKPNVEEVDGELIVEGFRHKTLKGDNINV
jgi:hypothetical protein